MDCWSISMAGCRPWLWWWCPRVLVSVEHDTWHGTPWHCWGGLCSPVLQLLFYLAMTSRSPHCVPHLLSFSFHHISHDEADLFLKISRYLPFSIMSKQTGPTDTWHTWSHRDQALSHGTLETWRASSDEMSQWLQAGVIYRGLESAKLSRTWGLPLGPPSDTQTQSNSQKHEH